MREIKLEIGFDLTDLLKIKKYEAPVPACLSGEVKGMFPAFLKATDEERCQNLTDQYPELIKNEYYSSEKCDGTSATFYLKDNEFGVCSRNLDLKESENNSFWKVARVLKIEEGLRSVGKNIVIQGELIGEGIQKNLYKIKGQTVRLFNAFDIDSYSYFTFDEFIDLSKKLGIETVPILNENVTLPADIQELITNSDGKSMLNPDQNREGIVYRTKGKDRISFKVISNKFLEKNE